MGIHQNAGKLPNKEDLVDITALIRSYYAYYPDHSNPVSFGTSGHRGCALKTTFNEQHIIAICMALVEYRQQANITGPIIIGFDTHALSQCAYATTLQVLATLNVPMLVQQGHDFTPTPVVSRTILRYNQNNTIQADGIVITPSHNPPEDGGFKYNPPHGGPAGSEITNQIQTRANALLRTNALLTNIVSYPQAIASEFVTEQDFAAPYIDELANVVDMEAIAQKGITIGVDPLGGSGIYYWEKIAKQYGVNITLANKDLDPQFGFMPIDKDGKIRMDCSSPYAMAKLIELKDDYDIAVGNDPDYDRHGIVTASHGLMNPNHYLAAAIDYLFSHRSQWPATTTVGKTLVSSAIIDKVASNLERPLYEVPVGFKWFVEGLQEGRLGFSGEESAGATFLQKDGTVWTTDKDGIIMALLAAEILAVTGENPAQRYDKITERLGTPVYTRVDAPCPAPLKAKLTSLQQSDISQSEIAGEKITAVLTQAPGNHGQIGGLKVTTENGWFAARPSGTEDIYKIYAESFQGEAHLNTLIESAQQLVASIA